MEEQNKHLYSGITGLVKSKKGTFSLLIFLASLVAVFMSKIDGASFAAIVSAVTVIYNYTTHKTDVAALQMSAKPSYDPNIGNKQP